MREMGIAMFITFFVMGILFWISAVVFMFRTVTLRKPHVSMWRDTGGNPFNLLLLPDKLSESGLVARKRCFYSVLGFVLSVLFGMVAGGILSKF